MPERSPWHVLVSIGEIAFLPQHEQRMADLGKRRLSRQRLDDGDDAPCAIEQGGEPSVEATPEQEFFLFAQKEDQILAHGRNLYIGPESGVIVQVLLLRI